VRSMPYLRAAKNRSALRNREVRKGHQSTSLKPVWHEAPVSLVDGLLAAMSVLSMRFALSGLSYRSGGHEELLLAVSFGRPSVGQHL
jgi:hypothetical protein